MVEQVAIALINFLQHPSRKVLLIVNGSETDIKRILDQYHQAFVCVDMALKMDIERALVKVTPGQSPLFVFIHGELENYYEKYQLNRWSAKAIVICEGSLLHPTLDPSIYFAPRKGLHIQKELLAKVTQSRSILSPLPATATRSFNQKNKQQVGDRDDFRNHFLNQKLMSDDILLMQIIADRIRHDENFKWLLFQLIFASRYDEEMQIAAANSITALSYARVSLSGINFSYIRIPFADLKNVIMDQTNLCGADLTGVNFYQAWLREANLYKARLNEVYFGERPNLKHNDTVEQICNSSDDRYLATASGKQIDLWDLQTNMRVHTFLGHEGWVYDVQFSPDDDRLVSASFDKTIRIWDVKKRILLYVLKGHTSSVRTSRFNPNGKQVVSMGDWQDGTVRLWNPSNGTMLHVFDDPTQNPSSVAFSTDGSWLAIGSDNVIVKRSEAGSWQEKDNPYYPIIRIWHVNSGRTAHILRGHENNIVCVQFSPNGKLLASAGNHFDKTIRLWSVESGQALYVFNDLASFFTHVRFSLDGKWLASNSINSEIIIWDVADGSEMCKLQGHVGIIERIAFSHKNNLLVSAGGSEDHSVRLWDIANKKCLNIFRGHLRSVNVAQFSLDDNWIFSAGYDQTVRMWDISKTDVLQIVPEHKAKINGLQFSVDGKWLASGSDDGMVRIWDAKTGTIYYEHRHADELIKEKYKNEVTDIQFSSDGNWLASSGYNTKVRLFNIKRGKIECDLKGNLFWIKAIQFSPSSKLLATINGGHLLVWSLENMKILYKLERDGYGGYFKYSFERMFEENSEEDDREDHEEDIFEGGYQDPGNFTVLQFSSNSKWLAVGNERGGICVLDVEKKRVQYFFKAHLNKINTLCFDQACQFLATGAQDGVWIWNLENGEKLFNDKLCGKIETIIKLSPDSKLLAIGTQDDTITLLDINTRKVVKVLQGHNSWISAIVFSVDGRWLASSGGFDHTVRIWDINSGQCIAVLSGFLNRVTQLVWHHLIGLATGSEDGSIKCWGFQVQHDKIILRLNWGTHSSLYVKDCQLNQASGLSPMNSELLLQRGAIGDLAALKVEDVELPPSEYKEGKMRLASLATTLAKDGMFAQPKAFSTIVKTDKDATEIKPENINDSKSGKYDTGRYSVENANH